MEELDKQDSNKIPNPNGKGGFADNPQNINRNGRPKADISWADIVRQISDEVSPETGKQRKELIVRRLFDEAWKGNMAAMRILWGSVVGNKILVEGNLDVSGDRLEAVIDELLAGRNNNDTEAN